MITDSDYRAVAAAVERVWRAHTDKPLRIVGSTTFVNGIVFYFKDQPSTFDIDNPKMTPWIGDERMRREGDRLSRDGGFLHARVGRLRRAFSGCRR